MEEYNSLALPVRLFAVQNGKEQIALDLLSLQPEKDVFRSGEFAVSYQCEGMDCRSRCWKRNRLCRTVCGRKQK